MSWTTIFVLSFLISPLVSSASLKTSSNSLPQASSGAAAAPPALGDTFIGSYNMRPVLPNQSTASTDVQIIWADLQTGLYTFEDFFTVFDSTNNTVQFLTVKYQDESVSVSDITESTSTGEFFMLLNAGDDSIFAMIGDEMQVLAVETFKPPKGNSVGIFLLNDSSFGYYVDTNLFFIEMQKNGSAYTFQMFYNKAFVPPQTNIGLQFTGAGGASNGFTFLYNGLLNVSDPFAYFGVTGTLDSTTKKVTLVQWAINKIPEGKYSGNSQPYMGRTVFTVANGDPVLAFYLKKSELAADSYFGIAIKDASVKSGWGFYVFGPFSPYIVELTICQDNIVLYTADAVYVYNSSLTLQWSTKLSSQWADIFIETVNCQGTKGDLALNGIFNGTISSFFAKMDNKGNITGASSPQDWIYTEKASALPVEILDFGYGLNTRVPLTQKTADLYTAAQDTTTLTFPQFKDAKTTNLDVPSGQPPVQVKIVQPVGLTDGGQNETKISFNVSGIFGAGAEAFTYSTSTSTVTFSGTTATGTVPFPQQAQDTQGSFVGSLTVNAGPKDSPFGKNIDVPYYYHSQIATNSFGRLICSTNDQTTGFCINPLEVESFVTDKSGFTLFVSYAIDAVFVTGYLNWKGEVYQNLSLLPINESGSYKITVDPTNQLKAVATSGKLFAYLDLASKYPNTGSFTLPFTCSNMTFTDTLIYCADGISFLTISKINWQIQQSTTLTGNTWTILDVTITKSNQVIAIATTTTDAYIITMTSTLTTPKVTKLTGKNLKNGQLSTNNDHTWFVGEKASCTTDDACFIVINVDVGDLDTSGYGEYSLTAKSGNQTASVLVLSDGGFWTSYGDVLVKFTTTGAVDMTKKIMTASGMSCSAAALAPSNAHILIGMNCDATTTDQTHTTVFLSVDGNGVASSNTYLYTSGIDNPSATSGKVSGFATDLTPTAAAGSTAITATVLSVGPLSTSMQIYSNSLTSGTALVGQKTTGPIQVKDTDTVYSIDVSGMGLDPDHCKIIAVQSDLPAPITLVEDSNDVLSLAIAWKVNASDGTKETVTFPFTIYCNRYFKSQGSAFIAIDIPKNKENTLGPGAIAGIVIGVLAVIGIGVFFWFRHRKQRSDDYQNQNNDSVNRL
eukprot:CAMPEP_0114984944 /NCGR_PEP_ID=MMETSP0216-20121206/7572_1 /TAXON_ID=223996 /ORGANISM="Protocruzia adherens, Strain Boccale" /LENGTH=1125 /DNA_ID=CAMNT_0002347165 /DNA_START=115 /DNA_END=3492 /DNA_ORIENTATION=+